MLLAARRGTLPLQTAKVGDKTSDDGAAESRSTAYPFTRAEEASCVAMHF